MAVAFGIGDPLKFQDEVELEDMHKYLNETELEKIDIETYTGAGEGFYVDENTIRQSIIASVKNKSYVIIGEMWESDFTIYKEDDYIKVFHRGMHFCTNENNESDHNHVEILNFKDEHAEILVKVLWCDEFIHHYFKVNVKKFNEFYEKNKNKESFEEEELSEHDLELLIKHNIIKTK